MTSFDNHKATSRYEQSNLSQSLYLFSPETAINIGYSCKLLTDEMEDVFIIDGESYKTVEEQLMGAKDIIKKSGTPNNYPGIDVSFQSGSKNPLQPNENGTPLDQVASDGDGVFALVINGHSLVSFYRMSFVLAYCIKRIISAGKRSGQNCEKALQVLLCTSQIISP
jgi:hypothetical protein